MRHSQQRVKTSSTANRGLKYMTQPTPCEVCVLGTPSSLATVHLKPRRGDERVTLNYTTLWNVNCRKEDLYIRVWEHAKVRKASLKYTVCEKKSLKYKQQCECTYM